MERSKKESQRGYIFHSWFTIQGQAIRSLIIDGGSCVNVTWVHLIKNLSYLCLTPMACSPQWLKKGNRAHMTKQALVAYSIGNFKDKVLCDILPMDA